MASNDQRGTDGVLEALPTEELNEEFHRLMSAVVQRAVASATDRVGSLTEKLSDIATGEGPGSAVAGKAGEAMAEGKSPAKAALSAGAEGIKSKVSQALGGGGGSKSGKKLKVTNIVEEIDIGAPIDVVYNQWTQFQDFSQFMKKVESVEQKDEQKVEFKAQVLWSHRNWQATITDQIPDERIVWESSGPKGHVDGAVTFHELVPGLTRVLVVLEYHPQGLFERTGNLWRAQGRRVRLELKHFRRHVMTEVLLHPEDVEGWRGEIHDGDVVTSDEEMRRRDEESSSESDAYDEQDEPEEEDEDDIEDRYGDEAEDDDQEEEEDDDARDEYDADDEYDQYEDDDMEDDDMEGGEEEPPRRRSRHPASAGRR